MRTKIIILTLLALLSGSSASFGQRTMYNLPKKTSTTKKVANYLLKNLRSSSGATRSTTTSSTTTKKTNRTVASWVKDYNAAFKNCYFVSYNNYGDECDMVFGPANTAGNGKAVLVVPASGRSKQFSYSITANGTVYIKPDGEKEKITWNGNPIGFTIDAENIFFKMQENAQKYNELLNWNKNNGSTSTQKSETSAAVVEKAEVAPEPVPAVVYEVTDDSLEQKPAFTGGEAALTTFLANNIKYPVVAVENGVQGQVTVSVIVETDGSLSDFKVTKSVDSSLDREALRVVKAMPKWEPGKHKGEAVRVRTSIPISFRLN